MAVVFRTTLQGSSGNAVGIEVPEAEMAKLGPARKYPGRRHDR